MLESKFALLFRHWLRANPGMTSAYELKQTERGSIPFSCLEEHQADYLQAIKSDKGVLIRVLGTNGEPDYVYLRNCPACVVVKYPGSFCVIDIGAWLLEKSKSPRKSLTEARAGEIGIRVVF